ncbi:MAG: histidine phosphotransferase, partial [Mesorhizobium sp.]
MWAGVIIDRPAISSEILQGLSPMAELFTL